MASLKYGVFLIFFRYVLRVSFTNSKPLSVWKLSGFSWVTKHSLIALNTVADFLSDITTILPYLEKLSTLVKIYIPYQLLNNLIETYICLISFLWIIAINMFICHLLFRFFLSAHISQLKYISLTSFSILSHQYPNFFISSTVN